MFRFLVAAFLIGAPVCGIAASFDFTQGALRSAASASMTSGGVTMRATGGDGAGAAFDLALGGGRGLGIAGQGDSDVWAGLVDGWGASHEVLTLNFDRRVRLTSITFAWADQDDRLDLTSPDADRTFKLDRSGLLDLGAFDWSGTEFALAPGAWTFCAHVSGGMSCEERQSGFRVTGVEVEDVTPVVPLPASAMLLVGGLAGLGAMAWRRRGAPQA